MKKILPLLLLLAPFTSHLSPFTSHLSPFTSLMAQKPKYVEFTAEALPDELLDYWNASTADKGRQKEFAAVVKDFRSVYGNFDGGLQERLAAIYTYAVKAKMKPHPEMTGLTRTLTSIATRPSGGKDVADAYNNASNLVGFVTTLEAFARRKAKAKAVTEYVEFCDLLFAERVLYRSHSSEWRFDANTRFRLGVEGEKALVWFETPANLHYASGKDEAVVKGTTGVYDYKENLWKGEGGRVEWTRTGLKADECYADLGSYEAETKFPKLKADSVDFVHTGYFTTPIRGRIEDQLSVPQDPEKYSYPRFRSYQRDFVIPDLVPDVDYSGSFMMNGSKFITASSKHPARLVFKHGGKPRLTVTSLKFTVSPTRISSDNATVALAIGEEDSIANTGVSVRYVLADKEVVLVNDPSRNFYSPFIDTYHALDIYSETLTWRLEEDELHFSNLGTAGSYSSSTFESSSYYTYAKFREINGIDQVSPIERAYDFMQSNGSEFTSKRFSDFLGLDMSQTLLMLHNLSKSGLVSYNEMTGRVKVKDKLVDYHEASKRTKGFDYDAIRLESSVHGDNAVMRFSDDSLRIRGIKSFTVSDSHMVVVYPDSASGRRVTVGPNRSLHFSGRIDCGKFIYTVKDCDFSYEKYSFNMPVIKQMHFYVPDFKDPKAYEQLVRTPLSDLVGILDIDKPDNHSGMVKNKEYPIFKSLRQSFVYYDAKKIQDGQYTRDRFYYTIVPFTLNSLTDFVTDSLQFTGVLTSAGIFPDIEQPLRVQPDYYLGFRIETPANGYPAYGGKGHYSKKITLNQTGLRGKGELDYLTSHTRSSDFLFLPDSMVTVTDTFDVREEKGFPDIHNGRASMHWLPYADSMAVATLDKGLPFVMYRGETTLRGRVDLMPKGAAACGTANVLEGTFVSQHFTLASRQMDAKISDFTLRSHRFKTIAFATQQISSHIDYDERRADLKSTEGVSRSELQLVQYEAFADSYTWEMDKKDLMLANSERGTSEGLDGLDIRQRLPKAGDMPGVRFVSTDPAREKLSFASLLSTYSYEVGDISNEGVFLVNVADAAIAPAADTLHVVKGGDIRLLNKADLVFNRQDAYHLVTGADLLITSANSLTGKGYYDYYDDTKKPQRVFLNNIDVQNGITVATGAISDSASFTLSSAFGFAGTIRLEGNQKWAHFEGGVRLLQPCIPQAQLGLLAYADYTDPEHIHVIVPELPTDWKGNRITASIVKDKTTMKPHAAFLTNEKVADNELLSAHGVLTYLGGPKMYMIGSEEKVSNPEGVVAPYLSLSTTDCIVEGEGEIRFPLRNSQASFFSYGTASVGITSDMEDHINTVFGVTFPIADNVISALYDNIKEDLRTNPVGATTNPEMRHALMHLLGAENGAGAYAVYSGTGEFEKIPDEMVSTLLFDNIRWQYAPSVGFYYDGKVGLVGVGKKPLGVEINLKAQISKRNNNQTFTFYVQIARDHWYYFKYDLAAQELTIYSSVGTWDELIKAIPAEKRQIEKEGLGTFHYRMGNTSSEVPNWLSWFTKTIYPDENED